MTENIIFNILFVFIGVGIFVRDRLIVNNYEDKSNLDGLYKTKIMDFFYLPNKEYLRDKSKSNIIFIMRLLSYLILSAILSLVLLVAL